MGAARRAPADTRRDWKLRELRCEKEALQAQLGALQVDTALLQSRLAQATDKLQVGQAECDVGGRGMRGWRKRACAAACGAILLLSTDGVPRAPASALCHHQQQQDMM